MMKHFNVKWLWLFGLVPLGAVAQDGSIGPGIVGDDCISSNGGTQTYSIANPAGEYAGYEVTSVKWTVGGGIAPVGGTDGMNLTVTSLSGTDYESGYSKYGKGKITAKVHLERNTQEPVMCNGEPVRCNGETIYSYTHCFADYEVSKTVSKSFSIPDGENENAVVGPVCVAPGERVTYSIAPWVTMINPELVGYDSCVWFPAGIPAGLVKDNVLYYSADKSSITFDVDDNPGGAVISVQVGKCNVPGNVLSLNLLNAIPEPIITPSSCLPAGIRTQNFSVSNPVDGVNYTWEVDDNWTISGSATGESVAVIMDATNAAWVYVTAEHAENMGCRSVSSRTRVSRNVDPTLSTITVSGGKMCHAVGETVSVTLNGAPSPSKFAWTLPEGWNITGTTDSTATIQITPTASAQSSGTIRVAVAGCEGEQGVTLPELTMNVRPGDANDISISGGSLCVTKGETYTLSTTPTTPAPVSYHWMLGSGWTNVQYAADSLSVTATATGTNLSTSVKPIGVNGCDGVVATATATCMPTAPNQIVIDYMIAEKSCINFGMEDNIKLTAQGSDALYYEWDLVGLGNIVGATNTKTITVKTNGQSGTFNVKVRAYNDMNCGMSNEATLSVTIEKMPIIAQYSKLRKYYTAKVEDEYAGEILVSDFDYEWRLDDVNITDPESNIRTTTQADGTYINSTTHQFVLIVEDKYFGCKSRNLLSAPSTDNGVNNAGYVRTMAMGIDEEEAVKESHGDMVVFPNPVSSLLHISMPESDVAKIVVTDMNGKTLLTADGAGKNVEINVSDFSAGSYIVRVIQNGKRYSKIFMIK